MDSLPSRKGTMAGDFLDSARFPRHVRDATLIEVERQHHNSHLDRFHILTSIKIWP